MSPAAEFKEKAKSETEGREAHIFLDMDGVIANIEEHGRTHNKFDANGRLDYDSLDFKWWSSVPEFTGAHDFFKKLQKRGLVRFLSGPIPSPACYGGKAAWIEKFGRERGKWAILDLMIVRSIDKELIAGPDRILIDDSPENVENWEKAGGIGIHHDGDFNKTLQKLDAALKKGGFVPPKTRFRGRKTPAHKQSPKPGM